MSIPVDDHNWEKISERLDMHDSRKPKFFPLFLLVFLLIGIGIATFTVLESVENNSYSCLSGVTKDLNSRPLAYRNEIIPNNQTSKAVIQYNKNYGSSSNQNVKPIYTNLNSTISDNHISPPIVNSSLSPVESMLEEDFKQTDLIPLPYNNDGQVYNDNIELSNNKSLKFPQLNPNPLMVKSLNIVAFDALNNKKSFGKSKEKRENKHCPFGIESNNKSLDLYMSHDIVSRKFTSDNASLQNIVSMREESEKPLYSFSVGARFGYNISYRWNIHTGFNYTQLNDRFNYIDPESNQEREITIKDYIYENGKIVDSIITTETVVIPGTVKIQSKNKYRSYDIPLIGRYTILANKHLSFSATIGTFVNLSHSSSGKIIDVNGNPMDLKQGRVNKTQLGLSSYTGLSLAYHLAGDLDFIFEPHARIYFNDISRDSNPINQSQNIYGVATGLRYKF
jgi:hypothetical protein